MTDDIAERARKLRGVTLRSDGHIARVSRLADTDADFVTAQEMLTELGSDNLQLAGFLRAPCALRRAWATSPAPA
ncbi:DNA-binding ferritin-like protein [Ancylobacter vacuolatus]|uniref:DNA-binding ferritin-like protein n=1 Tax=Ancylobacter vacuolatus TaxID=223389 RepID=A0ABU0DK67_9HYPH|nr:DNA-binding ferritin-like protein [Ancylobacter vacuolatus]